MFGTTGLSFNAYSTFRTVLGCGEDVSVKNQSPDYGKRFYKNETDHEQSF